MQALWTHLGAGPLPRLRPLALAVMALETARRHMMFGRRVYINGHRIHHGLAGTILIILGTLLVAHDWHDRPWPLRDR
jgi:hypothetical protein